MLVMQMKVEKVTSKSDLSGSGLGQNGRTLTFDRYSSMLVLTVGI